MDERDMSVPAFLELFHATAELLGFDIRLTKTQVYDLRNRERTPSIPVMKIVKRLSDGELDVEAW